MDVRQTVAEEQVHDEISAAISNAPVPFAAEYISPPNAPLLPNGTPRLYLPLVLSSFATLLAYFYFLLRNTELTLIQWIRSPTSKLTAGRSFPSHVAGE